MDKKTKQVICTAFANGKRHDFRLFKESKAKINFSIKVITDTGYQGIQKLHSNSALPKAGEVSEVDPQAGWTKKGDAYTYGYKAHVGVDQGSGIIVKAHTTSANVHDSQMLPHVVTGEE